MAITVTNSDVVVTTGNALTVANGNSAFVNEGASLVSTANNGAAVQMQGTSTLSLNGLAFGADGVRWNDLGDKTIFIGSQGSVQAQNEAINGFGSSTSARSFNLVNAGEIASLRNPALANTQAAIDISSMNLRIVNTGTISAASGIALQHNGIYSTSEVENSGTIQGNIRMQSTNTGIKPDMVFANTGVIHGSVLLTGFNEALATISGTITRSVTFSSVAEDVFQLSSVQLNRATIGADLAIAGNSKLSLIDSMIGRDLSLSEGYHSLLSFSGTVVMRNLTATNVFELDLNLTGGRVNGSVILGDAIDILTLGDGFAHDIQMRSGDDTVHLTAGADVDRLDLGLGNDTLTIDSGVALGRVFAGSGDDIVTMGNSSAQFIGLDSGNDTFIGGDGNDSVRGDTGNDEISTGAGNDTVIMFAFNVSDGNDTVDGGSGVDTLSYRAVLASVGFTDATGGIYVALDEGLATARASNTTDFFGIDLVTGFENVIGGGFADDIIGSSGANRLRGEAGNDTLNGGGGADTLQGGDGADRLIGGGGRDVMTGGEGADTFVFLFASESSTSRTARDVITDFQNGIDFIDLSAIDANTALAGPQDFVFAGNVANSGVGTVRYVHLGGNTIVYANTGGNGAAEFGITLHGIYDLKAGDFLLS